MLYFSATYHLTYLQFAVYLGMCCVGPALIGLMFWLGAERMPDTNAQMLAKMRKASKARQAKYRAVR
jgi:hypothetical protein